MTAGFSVGLRLVLVVLLMLVLKREENFENV
jgi:hypothetical protein